MSRYRTNFGRPGIKRWGVAVSASLALVLVLAGCGGDEESGSGGGDGYQVKIVGSLTGVQSQQALPYVEGASAALKDYNKSADAKIEFKVIDDQSEPTAAQAGARSAIGSDPVAILDASSATFPTKLPLYKSSNTTVIAANAIGYPNEPWLFGASATGQQLAASLVNAGAAVLDGSLDGKRVAFIGIDAPSTRDTHEYVANGLKEQGAIESATEFVPPGTPSFASGAAKVVSSDPEVVIIQDSAAGTALEVKALLSARFAGPIIVNYAGSDDTTLGAMNSDQVFGIRPYVFPKDGLAIYDAAKEFGYTATAKNEGFTRGWIMGQMLIAGLEKCGDGCDTTKLQKALESLGTFDIPGDVLEFGPLELAVDRHHPLTKFALYQWDDTAKEAVKSVDEVDFGPPGYRK